MVRPLRIVYEDAIYHVMNRGQNRQSIFIDQNDYKNFLSIIDQAYERWKIQVYGFCLMGNHYHLCLGTPESNISRVMRHIDGVYTQRFNRSHNQDGSLFRGRYKALVVEEESYLSQVVRYIHLNPVKAGLTKQPQEYKWSSHQYYTGFKKKPAWLDTDVILNWIGSGKKFHSYVMEGNTEELEKIYHQKNTPIVVGDTAFAEEVRLLNKTQSSRYHGKDDKKVLRPKPDAVIDIICQVYGLNKKDILFATRGVNNEARKLAMLLVGECCDLTNTEIVPIFNLTSEKTVSWARSVIQAQMSEEKIKKIKRKIEQRITN